MFVVLAPNAKAMKNKNKKYMHRYEGNRLMFVVLAPNAKAAYKNLKFYYTIIMEVRDMARSHIYIYIHLHTYI
jgi:hypothetical protein